MLCLPQKPLSLAEAWSQPNARDTILRQAVCPRPSHLPLCVSPGPESASPLGLPEGPDAADHATQSRSWNLKVTPLRGVCATAKERRKEGTLRIAEGGSLMGLSQESGESRGQHRGAACSTFPLRGAQSL